MHDLNIGLIGNCRVSALVDRQARIVWFCLPRFDGTPIFHGLLGAPAVAPKDGVFVVEVENLTSTEQYYVENTAILKTILKTDSGAVEITDFCPRYYQHNRAFRPQALVRRVAPIDGNPRITIRCRPRFDYGALGPSVTYGSNHLRYTSGQFAVRLTTDAPIDYLLEEQSFRLVDSINLVLGPDETLTGGPSEMAREFEENTASYWRTWSHRLALPLEWQDAVIRAAITLKLCSYEPTGAIVAAMTSSIPEASNSERNWDYRYCWARDSVFVVRALNRLAAVSTMENYFQWMMNIIDDAQDDHIQPVYGLSLRGNLEERIIQQLPGYRGMGPVRVGNQAYQHFQHDTYGNLVLGAAPAFFDGRLSTRPGEKDFPKLEKLGDRAIALHDKPDAGMWELRSRVRIHTSSSLMCWAACDRLSKIAAYLRHGERARFWAGKAALIRKAIMTRAWSEKRNAFVESFEGTYLDASALLMNEVGFVEPTNPKFVATVERIEEVLGRGVHVMRYEEADDFGPPKTAFTACAFWLVDALAKIGRREEARERFEGLLKTRNHLGLMSEDIDPKTGEAWGNFPQTYSMVGIVNSAVALSRPWDAVV